MPANVPGCVHLDLMAAGVIPDPFAADNEEKVQWVGEADWTCRREFVADMDLLSQDRVYLECDGLDTLARVRLNGKLIAVTDNMFIGHGIDITGLLRQAKNTVEITFRSPIKYVKPLLKNPGPVYWLEGAIHGSPFVRKAPYQWGWDWGPKLLTCGIWRPIRLAGYSGGRIRDLRVTQEHLKNGSVRVRAAAEIERLSKRPLTAVARLTCPDGTVIERAAAIRGSKWTCSDLVIENPELWWPNGHGDQPLYELAVSIMSGDEILHSETRGIGLRTIRLEQKKDRWGTSFAFVVNGKAIFCKGANWIPSDSFPTRVTGEWYEDLILSAVKANMNMLRVWGGGVYEDERFYDLCDKHGILVWQDFMFSGGCHYPMDDAFLANVRQEVTQVVRRLRHRACLTIWCGNNEMEWYLWAGWIGGDNERRKLDHTRLFREIIGGIVAEEDGRTPYWPSSPCSRTPYETPNCEHEGNGHYWDVWHGKLPYKAYRERNFRFITEFGCQSLPHVETARCFADPADANITGPEVESHQKCDTGNSLVLYYLTRDFRLPKDFTSTIYLSQLMQAEAIRYGVEHWRRSRPRCMGTIYWQLNDCWPGISWSGIDYNRRWKALHYAAKRFYAPVLLSAEDEGTRVDLHATNDTSRPFAGTVVWSLETLDGERLDSGETSVTIPPESSRRVKRLDFSKRLSTEQMRRTVLVYELLDGGRMVSRGLVTFRPSRTLELPEPGIAIRIRKSGETVEIELKADKTARFVEIDLPGENLRLSDNFFDLPAGRAVTVVVESRHADIEQLRRDLVVRSLRDSY